MSRRCAERFGLDKPVPVQLALYVKNILALDLGYSFRNQSAVLPLILARLSATLLLMGTTLVLSLGDRRSARTSRRRLGADLEGSPHLGGRHHRLCHAALLDRADAHLAVRRQARLAADLGHGRRGGLLRGLRSAWSISRGI